MADCCEAGIDAAELEADQRRVLIIVMLINIVTFGGMVAASYLSHSSALLSGTLDNLGDALTYGMSIAVVGASTLAKARVALFKGLLISLAALGVAVQIGWRIFNLDVPEVTTMGLAALLNLAANGVCLALLTRHRHDDVNMTSVWECSRNDVMEGVAVVVTALLVWGTNSGLPDVIVAIALLVMFTRSAMRVTRSAFAEMKLVPAGS